MIYKILVTTIVTRSQAVAVDTKIIELDHIVDARSAVAALNQERGFLESAIYKQKAIALNF